VRVLRGHPTDWDVGPERTALAVGVFDGVHLGHRHVLGALVQRARERGIASGVVTFDPHPLSIVAPERVPPMLTTIEQRLELLEGLGVEVVAVVAFDDELRIWSPATFVTDLLAGSLHAATVVVGEDFRFGRDRTGHVGLLRELGMGLGFETEVVPLVGGDQPISSTRIRAMIAAGDVAGATAALGRPHEVRGIVVPGDGRGRSIGIPTANVAPRPGIAMPRRGVYAVRAGRTADEDRAGVANVGVRPTFAGSDEVLEVHLLDLDEDLYGAELRVRFHDRIRDEERFESVDALVRQIGGDVEEARRLLS
jgi:riboflavin kinase/FMN adenylyltransferase